ncbi:MAG: flippase-like domain-containing protein, partial [Muribaculaceae bacterium]|nr:flippase-like domain-containing protein [Muribaculaceae bacterium]
MVTSHTNITPAWRRAIPIVRRITGYIIPAAVSVALIVWLFHKVDFHTITTILRDSCDYRWLLIMCAVLTISRSVRGIRWGIQLRAAGVAPMPPFAEMVSIFGAYALNLILTGVGEAWRCIYVSRRQHASISTVVGTDLGDRISDAIMIIALIILSLSVAHPVLQKFIDHYSCGEKIMHILSSPWLWITLGAIIAIAIWLLCTSSRNKVITRIRTECARLWKGFRILFTMKHQLLFWTYTLVIWIAYFLMTYLCFFAFPFTRTLIRPDMAYGLLPGLVVFIFGSLSIAIPATGGLGPWNLAVIFALSLYGISTPDATAYS